MRAVAFDVGETLVDETRAWGELADAAGVPRLTLFAALGALIERDDDHRRVWELLGVPRPIGEQKITAGDLYPDAASCLRDLRAAGYLIGLAANQPAGAHRALQEMDLPVDFVGTSADWGVEKPSPAFFARLADAARALPNEVVYVGDRLDNDVLPAQAAGMRAVLIRRGPWGHLHAQRPEADRADAQIDSLAELPAVLHKL